MSNPRATPPPRGQGGMGGSDRPGPGPYLVGIDYADGAQLQEEFATWDEAAMRAAEALPARRNGWPQVWIRCLDDPGLEYRVRRANPPAPPLPLGGGVVGDGTEDGRD